MHTLHLPVFTPVGKTARSSHSDEKERPRDGAGLVLAMPANTGLYEHVSGVVLSVALEPAAWVQTPALLGPDCGNSGKLANLPELQFPHA